MHASLEFVEVTELKWLSNFVDIFRITFITFIYFNHRLNLIRFRGAREKIFKKKIHLGKISKE